ncbi:MAG TPA: HepT-like ribonuclease domain-containing protein, partial [Thermoleophilaceae bacterium]|nr:HepT-like ribonuclease domain-containing protein [Thermoleophilaceae bacterium]
MVDRVALDLRARRLEDELARLERARGLGRDGYLGDPDAQTLVERALQIAIQACIDIGAHLVAVLGYGYPTTTP